MVAEMETIIYVEGDKRARITDIALKMQRRLRGYGRSSRIFYLSGVGSERHLEDGWGNRWTISSLEESPYAENELAKDEKAGMLKAEFIDFILKKGRREYSVIRP